MSYWVKQNESSKQKEETSTIILLNGEAEKIRCSHTNWLNHAISSYCVFHVTWRNKTATYMLRTSSNDNLKQILWKIQEKFEYVMLNYKQHYSGMRKSDASIKNIWYQIKYYYNICIFKSNVNKQYSFFRNLYICTGSNSVWDGFRLFCIFQ